MAQRLKRIAGSIIVPKDYFPLLFGCSFVNAARKRLL